jgi:2-polyprenyl-6-methoxyphenol hydroxylase-like FAD-dependent oxidoreductase
MEYFLKLSKNWAEFYPPSVTTASPPPTIAVMTQKFDVCIRGDGIVGRTLALLLARQRLRVGLVRAAPHQQTDVRAYSLNENSRQLLERVGCWPDEQHATPINTMRVWGDDQGFVEFGSQASQDLSWMVDVPVLEAQLARALDFQTDIVQLSEPSPAWLTAICEGRHSTSREQLGIEFEAHPYQQHAVAARLQTSMPHRGQAFQWFNQGPQGLEILALLPLGGPQGMQAALVWSLPPAVAQEKLNASAQDFTQALQNASQGVLGQLHLESERAMWPLQLACTKQWAGRYADGTAWVLAGDAAHNIHPLAGLGLNLGLADVAELVDILQAKQTTEYWRNAGDSLFLRRYERARRAGILPTWIACDGLQRLFAHPNTAIQQLRNWGMSGFNTLSPLKQWIMAQAKK